MRNLWTWIKSERNGTRARVLAYLALAVAIAGTLWITTNNQIQREHNAQLRTCDRVQYLRDQANGTNFLVYDTFNAVYMQQQKAIDSGHLKGAALKMTKQSVARSKKVVDTTVVTGPTDCKAATNHPDTYAAPAPEFIKSGSPRIRAARKRAEELIEKAKKNEPLYKGEPKN